MKHRHSPSKPLAALALAVGAAVALAGCAGGSSSSTSPSTTAKITGNTMTFVTDQGGPAGDKYTQLIKAFEAKYPKYKVTMEILPGDNTYNSVITSRISSGKSPDLFEIINDPNPAQPFTKANLLTDLGKQPWVSKLTPVVANAAKSNGGHTWGFISQVDASGFFYNKSLFAKYHVSVPTNWTQLLAAVKTFRAAGVTPMGIGGKDGWPVALTAFSMAAQQPSFAAGNTTGPKLLSGTDKFSDSTGWKSTIDDFSSLVKAGAYDPNASGIGFAASTTDFDNGKVAMFYQGDFAIPAIRQGKPNFTVGMFALPYKGSPAPVTVTYGSELAIPAKAPNAGLAEKFLDFLSQSSVYKNYLTTGAAFSSLTGVSGKLDPALEELAPVAAKHSIEAYGGSGLSTATSAALTTGVTAILAGSGSTASTLSGMDSAQATQ